MNFTQALEQAKNWKKIRKDYWVSNEFLLFHNEVLTVQNGPQFKSVFHVYANDFDAKWEVIEEKRELSWDEIEKALEYKCCDGPILFDWNNYVQLIKKRLGF